MLELIQVKNENLVTTSVIVADVFNKRHDNVIAKIEALIGEINASLILRRPPMFEKSTYKDVQDKSRTMYYINRDGLALLAMGFTGSKALEWKLKYIQAFNEMEEKIKSAAPALPDGRADVAKLILKASTSQLTAIKELYPEYFHLTAPSGSLEEKADANTSYQNWKDDLGITTEWIGEFPTGDIYNSYQRYCVENRYRKTLGKKQFYATLEWDFNLKRHQKHDGFRYFLTA